MRTDESTKLGWGAGDPRAARGLTLGLGAFLCWTVCFPKAGVKLGGVYPLTVGTLIGLAIAALSATQIRTARRILGGVAFRGMGTLWVVTSGLCLISLLELGLAPTLEKAVPVLLPVFTVPWLVARLNRAARPVDLLLGAAAVPLAYGVLQLVVSPVRVVVPGLTVNLSDWKEFGTAVFESKNNATSVGIKLVSTYQNGNLYGVLLVIVFAIVCARVVQGSRRRFDVTLLGAASVSAVLTLSRTCLIGCTAALCVVIASSRGRRAAIGIASAAVALVFISSTGLGGRLFSFDSTGAGRVPFYMEFFREVARLDTASFIRFIFVGFGPGVDGMQGYLEPSVRLSMPGIPFVDNVVLNLTLIGGVVLCVAYLAPMVNVVRQGRRLASSSGSRSDDVVGLLAALIGLVFVFSLDQSLNLPPSGSLLWLTYSMLAVASFRVRSRVECEQTSGGKRRTPIRTLVAVSHEVSNPVHAEADNGPK